MQIQLKNKYGVILKTAKKYCTEDIKIGIDTTNLSPENILEGVTILGVTGTAEAPESGGSESARPLKVTVSAGTSSQALEANTYYIFEYPTPSSLNLTLMENSQSYATEFLGEIQVGADTVEVTFPADIKWASNDVVTISNNKLTLKPKSTYLFSIINNFGFITAIPNFTLATPNLSLDGSILSWDFVENAESYDLYYVQFMDITITETPLVTGITTNSVDLNNYIDLIDLSNSPILMVRAKSNYYQESQATIAYVVEE